MPSSNDCWGIEIGSHAIKAIRLQRNGPMVGVTDFEYIPHKKVLSTPDIDADESIRVALDQLQSQHGINKSTVVVSVPGNKAFARFATLPPVEPKKIPDIVKFEAVQQIPFPIDDVEWDYQVFSHEDSPDVEVGIFAITKERILEWLSNLDAVNIPAHGVTLSPVAIYNALAFDLGLHDSNRGTVLLDIGTSATDVIVCEQGRVWLRTIPLGGHQFTEALVRSFKLSYSKAEQLKKEAATNKHAKQIFQAMRPVFVDLVQEVQRSLGYYQSLHRDAELIDLIGMGSTFNLPGLQKFLKQQLSLNVMRLEKFEKIKVEGRNAAAFGEHLVTMAPAYGLALQGLEMEEVSCNILPASMLRTQVWKAKRPWMGAAAAVMVLAAGIGYGKLKSDEAAYAGQDSTRSDITSVMNQAKDLQSQIKKVQGEDPRMKIENIRRIADYRNVWPLVVGDINGALMDTRPQQAILSGDIKEIQKIERNRRNQIDIKKVTVVYQFNEKTGEELINTASNENVKGDTLDIWGALDYEKVEKTKKKSSRSSRNNEDAGPSNTEEIEKPTYVITIVGSTPNAQGASFLTRFTDYFKKLETELQKADEAFAADQKKPDNEQEGLPPRSRPYRIVDAKLERIGNIAAASNPGGVNVPNINFNPNAARGDKEDPRLAAAKKLLPTDPLAQPEGQKTDQDFRIQLTIELVRPEIARQSQTQATTLTGN